MNNKNEPARGAQVFRGRAMYLVIAAMLGAGLLFPPAAPAQEAKARPTSFEHAAGSTCIVREEGKPGTMRAFHVYLVLDYEDGASWSTQEAIVPVELQGAKDVKDRWQKRAKARGKAFKYCDAWDLEVALELDKVSRQRVQKDAQPVQRAAKE